MAEIIGWIFAMLGQVGIFYGLFRFVRQIRRRGMWFGLLALPLLAILWFGYEAFQQPDVRPLSAFLAAGFSICGFGLLWFLLPSAYEAFIQYDQERKEKEELQLLLDQLPDLIILKDLALNYRKVNAAFAKMLGKRIELLIGRSDADFFPPKLAQTLGEDENRAIASKQPITRRVELMTVRGKRWFELTFTPLIDKLGVASGVLVNGYDLTEVIDQIEVLERDLHFGDVFKDITKKMFACDNETDLWDLVLEMVQTIGETAYAALAVASSDSDALIVEKASQSEIFQVGSSIPLANKLLKRVVQSSEIQLLDEPASWAAFVKGEEHEKWCWAVGIPIRLNNQVRAVIALFYEQLEKEKFAERLGLLQESAQIASLAWMNLHHKHELEGRLARTRRDFEQSVNRQRLEHFLTALAIRLVNAAPHQIDPLLEKALASFAEYIGAERGYVYLFKKEEGGLQARYRWSASGRLLPPAEIPEPFDAALAGLLESLNRQELVAFWRSGELPESLRVYFEVQDIDFLVAAPMVLRRTVVGYLGLEGKSGVNEGSMDQIGAVKAMADLVIGALDRKWSADELEERMKVVNQKMTSLELNNQRNQLLAEMSDLLQSCRTADEAYPIVARYAQILMPNSVGALYLLRSAQNMAEKIAHWGTEQSGENEFTISECWGIRRGKVHVNQDGQDPLCDHLGTPLPQRYICVPLMAQGETIGLLHIRESQSHENDDHSIEEMSKIGVSIADRIAPALSNLNLRDKLRSQAIRDPLTGLFNRRYMEETLEREIRRAARHKYSVGLIMCDIDQMKPINDRYGHDAGDAVLRQIGGIMKKIFRGEDVACRYGGDEFLIILPEASLSDVWQRAENLREAVKKVQLEYEGKFIGPVTVSVGVAAYPDFGSTVERLVQASDAAAYLAKREGGDRVMIAHSMDESAK